MVAAASLGDATRANEPHEENRAEIVAAPGSTSDADATLTLAEIEKMTGLSQSTLLRRIDHGQLPAVRDERDGRTWRVSKKVVLEFGPMRRRDAPSSAMDRERAEGERDARVFDALVRGLTVAQIVVSERVPVGIVLRLREAYLQAHDADRRGVRYQCSCGAEAHPAAARCLPCHTRSKVLSDAERAVLAGADLPASNMTTCAGCSASVDARTAESLCRGCSGKLSIGIDNGFLVVVLNGRVVRRLDADTMRAIAPALAHWIPRRVDVPEVPRAGDPPPRNDGLSPGDMRALIGAVLADDTTPTDEEEETET